MNEQEGYNVKDIIKRNIENARSDASRLKRPRGSEGKPPEMGPGFMQKRADAAAKIKAGRRELASQTENFITRTVGMLVDRIEELKQSTMQSAARKAKAQAKNLGRASTLAGKAGARGAAGTLSNVAGGRQSQATAIAKGAARRAAGEGSSRDTPDSHRATTAHKAEFHAARRELASHQNFIGKTVEILAERLIGNQKELDVDKSGKLDAKDFKMLRKGKRKDEAIKPDLSAYLAPEKPKNTPIDGRGIAKTPEQIAKKKAEDDEKLKGFRKQFGLSK
jgi:hypothetical protein